MTATSYGADTDMSQYPEGQQPESAENPFYTAETSDSESFARWMLEQQEGESEAN